MKNFGGWFTSQVTFIVTSFYAFGITPVILYSNGIIPASGLVLGAYWVTAVTSPLVILLTLARWFKKYPSPLTWLQAGTGVASVITLIYSYVALKTVYGGEAGMPGSTVAILASVIVVITAFAVYLTWRAMKNKFEN